MGLVIFGAMALYLIISIAVVSFAARAAKKNGKSPWRWGGGAALVMYVLVFWDHIPTLIVHKYYCEKEAGFWVYKTVEQWKGENPGVADTLTWRKIPIVSDTVILNDGTRRQVLNERFVLDITDVPIPLLSTMKHEEKFVDLKSKEVLAKRVSVSSGHGTLAVGGEDWRVIKFWLSLHPCIPEKDTFSSFLNQIHRLGRENDKSTRPLSAGSTSRS